ncbi:hypothetical protein Tco_1059388 [Tanacetum coccineum]
MEGGGGGTRGWEGEGWGGEEGGWGVEGVCLESVGEEEEGLNGAWGCEGWEWGSFWEADEWGVQLGVGGGRKSMWRVVRGAGGGGESRCGCGGERGGRGMGVGRWCGREKSYGGEERVEWKWGGEGVECGDW